MKTLAIFLLSFLLLLNISKAQTLLSIDPDTACVGQTLTVTITSQNTFFITGTPTGYLNGLELKQSVTVISPNWFNATTDTSIEAEFTIPVASPIGFYDVNVFPNLQGTISLIGGMFIRICTSVDNTKVRKVMQLFPNPADNLLSIALKAGSSSVEVKLYGIDGTMILSKKYLNIAQDTKMELDISDLPRGVYLLNLEINGERSVKKIFIE